MGAGARPPSEAKTSLKGSPGGRRFQETSVAPISVQGDTGRIKVITTASTETMAAVAKTGRERGKAANRPPRAGATRRPILTMRDRNLRLGPWAAVGMWSFEVQERVSLGPSRAGTATSKPKAGHFLCDQWGWTPWARRIVPAAASEGLSGGSLPRSRDT